VPLLPHTDLSYFTDVHFLKLFRISQFTIEYLLHVQNYLATNLKEKDERFAAADALARDLQAQVVGHDDKIKALKRDVKYYRKLSHALESMHGPLPLTSLQARHSTLSRIYVFCSWRFLSSTCFLLCI
jgi:hypothetical protein